MKKIFYIESAVLEGHCTLFEKTVLEGEIFDNGEFFTRCKERDFSPTMFICTEDELREFKDPNYETLARILKMAYEQASAGKGKERHANGRKFDDQPIMTIAKDHGLGYQTGQAEKKLKEAHTLLKIKGKDAAIRELLGVINYTAAAIAHIENMEEGKTK